jgi:hypothetical protein
LICTDVAARGLDVRIPFQLRPLNSFTDPSLRFPLSTGSFSSILLMTPVTTFIVWAGLPGARAARVAV